MKRRPEARASESELSAALRLIFFQEGFSRNGPPEVMPDPGETELLAAIDRVSARIGAVPVDLDEALLLIWQTAIPSKLLM